MILDESMTYDENESMELEIMWLSVMNERNIKENCKEYLEEEKANLLKQISF